jgi:hypothetical protein
MIYIVEKDFNHQMELLSFLAHTNELNVCAWLYPESSATTIAGNIVIENSLNFVPVTTYENGHLPGLTQFAKATKNNLSEYSAAQAELEKNCDSLALYKENDLFWFAATIGHEGLCLVRNNTQLTRLVKAGFAA